MTNESRNPSIGVIHDMDPFASPQDEEIDELKTALDALELPPDVARRLVRTHSIFDLILFTLFQSPPANYQTPTYAISQFSVSLSFQLSRGRRGFGSGLPMRFQSRLGQAYPGAIDIAPSGAAKFGGEFEAQV